MIQNFYIDRSPFAITLYNCRILLIFVINTTIMIPIEIRYSQLSYKGYRIVV